jgi:hypothetical protein
MAEPTVDEILQLRTELNDYWREFHTRADDLVDVYHGNYQQLWPNEFRRGEIPKVANWVKRSWDSYATMVGKVPESHIPTSKLRRVTKTRADKVEKILSGYNEVSGANPISKRYAWWLIGTGAAVIGVMPDPVTKGPKYFAKDPRTVLPSPGSLSTPLTSGSYGFLTKPSMTAQSLRRVIINETVTGDYLESQYEGVSGLSSAIEGHNINTPQELITYMDPEYWCIVVNKQKILSVEHGLDYVPVRFTTMEVPEQLGGQAIFEQNIGLVLAYMRTLNQKLTYNQNVVWPWLVVQGLNNIDPQNRIIEILERDGQAQFLNPPAELQAERDLEVLDRLIRVMNHDTEVMQGEAPGSVVTGAGARELNRDVKNTVLDFWDVMKPDYEFVRSAALDLDVSLYGGRTKSTFGRSHGEMFEAEYTPKKDIAGHVHVIADFGIGVGGMEGFVELMQAGVQGYVDEQTVMEGLTWIKSVSETRRKVLLDRIEKILLEMTAGGAPVPLINHMVGWRNAIESGTDPYKWLGDNPMPNPELPLGGEAGGGALPPESTAPGVPGEPPAASPPTPAQILALTQGRNR